MSNSTTSGARPAPSASCCFSACWRYSRSSAASSRSTRCWGRNEIASPAALRLRPLRRTGAALPDPAAAHYRTDVLLEYALPDLPAALFLAALVPGILRQSKLDAGD